MSAIKYMLDAKGTPQYFPLPQGAPNATPKLKEMRYVTDAYPYFTFERDSTQKELSLQLVVNDTDCQIDFQLSNNGTEFSTIVHPDLPLVFADGVRENGHIEFANIGANFVRIVISVNSTSADPYFCVFTGEP